MSEQTWIEQQKQNRLFRGSSQNSDARAMIEISPTNRYINPVQARKLTSARYIGALYGLECYSELCDMVEAAQLCIDGRSRSDYMKVAIEQWQGKMDKMKGKFALESLT